ncbi:hypothetical protein MMC15_005939 [Xylographa vitiligo]|nr:hypothetical protein [Xylographa vitiligo]
MVLQHNASGTSSTIWTLVHENQFVETVQKVLNLSGKVPGEVHVYDQIRSQACHGSCQLPRSVEYQLAQDLAFIAAHEEGVHSVSAATVEETTTQPGLIFNIASNSGIGAYVREHFLGIGNFLEQCARKGNVAASPSNYLLKHAAISELQGSQCTESIFNSIVRLCEHRVISRLKCKDWFAPAYYRKRRDPMHKDLKDAVDRHLRENERQTEEMRTIISKLQEFIRFMTEVDRENSTPTFVTRREALRLAGKVCDARSSLEIAFDRTGTKLDIASQKAIKAFDKVANYQRVSERLSRMAASSSFRHLFKSVNFRFLDHYECHIVHGRERFVHAEVQLAIFHRLQKTRPSPRTIGTTKAACYLCNLFLSLHPQYKISATHGVIFDAWTIPDVMSYSAKDRKELRSIVRSMQNTLKVRIGERNCRFLQFPIQSGIYHVPSLPSLAGTVIGSVGSVVGKNLSTDPTNLRTQGAVETSSVGSLAETVTVPLGDHQAESSLEIIIETPSQKSAAADEHYGTNGKTKIQGRSSFLQKSKLKRNAKHEKGVEPKSHTEAKLDGGAVNAEVSGPEGNLDSDQGSRAGTLIHDIESTIGRHSEGMLFTERSQMHCTVDTTPECANSLREPNGKSTETSPQDDADDADGGCTGTVHLSSDHLDRLSNVLIPVIKPDTTQESLGRAEQEAQESSPKQSRKKRRKRRHRFKSHHRSGRNDDYDKIRSRHSRSGHYKTPRRSKKRRYFGYGRSKTIQHSFVQGLLRVVRGTKRLFCG